MDPSVHFLRAAFLPTYTAMSGMDMINLVVYHFGAKDGTHSLYHRSISWSITALLFVIVLFETGSHVTPGWPQTAAKDDSASSVPFYTSQVWVSLRCATGSAQVLGAEPGLLHAR